MKSMEGFMLYNADLDAVRGLSDADFRKLILALSSVSKGEEMHPPAGEAGMAFHFMAFKVEQAYKKYLKRCEVNRENATAKEANGSESPITSNNKQVTSKRYGTYIISSCKNHLWNIIPIFSPIK